MIWAAVPVALAALAVLLWHMQKPRPPRIAISFVRFVPALPPAPAGWSRIALTVPRDPLTLFCLLAAAALCLWALFDAHRSYQATRPDHLGLRVVFDRSHSMSAADGGESRYNLALARLEAARLALGDAGAGSLCVEVIGVAGAINAAQPLEQGRQLQADLLVPLPEGGDPDLLVEAAARSQGECVLTHVLVLTDLAQTGGGPADGPRRIWDQVGAPVENSGLRILALLPAAFGQTNPEIRIEGMSSGQPPPARLRLEGPGGAQDLEVLPDPDAEGRWSALATYAGPGEYRASLAAGDGYAGDDAVLAQLDRPAGVLADWRLDALSRPTAIGAGGADAPLVVQADRLVPGDLSRPILIAYAGFGGATSGRVIGPFREDAVIFSALNFDALEPVLPSPWPGELPTGFAPVLTDDQGGVIIARRDRPFGLILPQPGLDLAEPQRSLSLALFFAGLADLLTLPPDPQSLRWIAADGTEISHAWRESLTARPVAPPADLAVFSMSTAADEAMPVWPWAVLAALVLLLAERAMRLARRAERIP
jgi:hypothetical protein